MIFYLLPSERKQSSMDLVKDDYFNIREDKEKNRFTFLNPHREKLLKEFKIPTSPLLPAWRRYKGKFWDSLEFWCLPSKVQQDIVDKGIIISPLFGMLAVSDLIPAYAVNFNDTYKGKTLKSFWKEILPNYVERILSGGLIFDFLTSEQREVIGFPKNAKIVRFEYLKRGKKVVNPMPHRAYTLRYIAEKRVNEENLEKINFYDYKVKEVLQEGNTIKVILEGEGKYI